MIKYIFILIVSVSSLLFANINTKIAKNKQILNTSSKKQKQATIKIKELAREIDKQNKNIISLEKKIKIINQDIEKHKQLLEEAKEKLIKLKSKSTQLIKEKKSNEEEIVETIVEEFSISIALKLASKNSLQELIDSEIYTLLSENSKNKILKLNTNYDVLSNNTKVNKKNIKKISSYIKQREKRKNTLSYLKKKHSKSLINLEDRHKQYQKELTKVIEQQKSLKKLLSKLNILKEEEIRKAQLKKRKKLRKLLAQKRKRQKTKDKKKEDIEEEKEEIQSAETRNKNYAKNLNLDVRKIGSSTDGVQIVRYRGKKTIAPLKSFKVVKKFGTYYDPIYKIPLFNESIVLKSKKQKAKVVSILNGKVVYAKKDAGMLENVVIVQHQNGIHTIYSHLDEIAPTLKVGKWIKKGYVVGRVNETLMFQATKNSAHINPRDLFRI